MVSLKLYYLINATFREILCFTMDANKPKQFFEYLVCLSVMMHWR